MAVNLNRYAVFGGLLTLFCILNVGNAFAFGVVDSLKGEAIAIDVDGQTRALTVGSRLEMNETLVTGDGAETLIVTDDKGLLALRPNSRVLIADYRAKGNSQDKFTLNLLKGALRSITGFIGKTAPKNYHIKTPVATIGIRGTDHEISIIIDKNAANEIGTYSKVNSGTVYLASRGITLDLKAGQYGMVPKAGLPQLLDNPPKELFNPSSLDDRVNTLKTSLDPEAASKLNQKQTEQIAAGGTTTSGELKIPKNCGFDTLAQKGLDEFFMAYESGNIALIQRRLDPAMPGYGAFLNSIIEDMNSQKQPRFLIKDRTAQCGSDLASINFKWEKRFLDLANFTPQLQVGQASVLVYLKAGEWKLSGITGDNPFAPNLSNLPNTLTTTPAQVSFASLPKISTPSATSTLTGTSTGITAFFTGSPCLPDNTNDTCSIAGIAGIVVATSVSCTGTPLTAAIVNISGSTPHSSVGPSASSASVTQVIPVSGSGTGQTGNGTVTCQATVTYPAGTPIFTVAPGSISTQIKLISSSQAGAGTAQVEAKASNGDREILTLSETTKGTFVLTGIAVGGGNPVLGNGSIDLTSAATITLRFVDSRTGSSTTTQFNVTP